jgi:hypothetical protein
MLFPELSEAEEKEVKDLLGLPANVKDTKEIIQGTLRNFHQYDVQTSDESVPVGTVRIKTQNGEALGTVRIKPDEQYGTIHFCGTFKINQFGEECLEKADAPPPWVDFGSVRISREDIDSGTVRVSSGQQASYLYRPPENWELSILSLEHGEWAPEMSEDAFGKFRKKRKGLSSVFDDGLGSSSPVVTPRKEDSRKRGTPDFSSLERTNSDPAPPGGERAWAKFRKDTAQAQNQPGFTSSS